MVLSITFYPVYKLLLRYLKYPWLTSLLTLLLVLILIIGPVTYIITALTMEITGTYRLIEERWVIWLEKIQEYPLLSKLYEKASLYGLLEGFDLKNIVLKVLNSLAENIGEYISRLFKNVLALIAGFAIMCLTIFYFLKDGEAIISYIGRFLPFEGAQKRRLAGQVKDMVIAVIFGGVTVALVQGILGGLAFLIFGLSSPVFWGMAIAVFSLVPIFGTFIIWGPASIILILGGSYGRGIGLMLFGFFVIGMADNVLKPIIIGGRTRLHTLLIFFSVLGGISFFGFIGFILGPLIVALCLSLLEMYTAEGTKID